MWIPTIRRTHRLSTRHRVVLAFGALAAAAAACPASGTVADTARVEGAGGASAALRAPPARSAVQIRRDRMARALAARAARRALPAGEGDAYARYAADFRLADSVVEHLPREAATSIEALGAHLAATLPSEAARARAVYRWVTLNIDYDVDAFYGSRLMMPVQSAWAVFERRRAVCEGYAYLVNLLGHAAGVDTRVVVGHAKAFSGDPHDPIRVQMHAWNAMQVDGRWWLLDASWGAGDLVDRRFVRRTRDAYFFMRPEQMVFSHRAREVEWQLLRQPLTLGDYGRLPTVPRDFWSLGFDPGRVREAARAGLRGGLVSAFGMPDRPLRVLEAPLDAELAPGSTHAFRIAAPGATAAFAISGTDWQPLPAGGGAFSGTGRVTADRLVVLLRYPDVPEGIVLLEYRTPAPDRARRR